MKTVFITGASSGFGESCARVFYQNGWRLILCDRRKQRLEKLKDELGGNEDILILSLDVREKENLKKAIDGLKAPFDKVNVLINNAGLALGMEPAHEASLDDWEQMIDTNIKGLIYCTRYLLPKMVQRNIGHIINIGSIAGTWPYPGGNVYGATKSFVKQFSNNLRCDLIGTNIRVSNIEPGLAKTEFSIVRFKGDREKADKLYEGTKPLTGEDIANIVYWVATQPEHVNINRVEVMPVCQAWASFAIHREKEN